MTPATMISAALATIIVTVEPVWADPPIVITGKVTRRDNGAPIAGATISIKTMALPDARVIDKQTTDSSGSFKIEIPARDQFACEAIAAGFAPDVVTKIEGERTCDFKLTSKLTLSQVVPRTPLKGRGPGLSMIAKTADSATLAQLTVRLHLTKPASCGSSGTTQQYDLSSKVTVGFGAVRAAITSDGKEFQAAGTAPLVACEETELSLYLQPAAPLNAGTDGTQILVTLPETLTLQQQRPSSPRKMSLAQPQLKSTYRSTIQRIDIELTTTAGSSASGRLDGLSIPVGVDQ